MEYSFPLLFAQGLLSFFTPCVLPLIPAYLGYISGQTAAELKGGGKHLLLVVNTLCFIAGFTAVFVALGASATLLGGFLLRNMKLMRYISGGLIVLFGIVMLDIIKLPWLLRERRFEYGGKLGGVIGAFLMGMAFSFGWTPCVGPVLAGVLMMLAVSGANLAKGCALLLAYSLGLGLPFFAAALFARVLLPRLGFLNKYTQLIKRVSGALLVIMGILVITNSLAVFATL